MPGKGVQCDAHYHQIAGFRPRVLKDNEQFPVIHAWFVTFPSAVAGRNYVVPVRIWADTKYGVLAVLANCREGRRPDAQGGADRTTRARASQIRPGTE